MFAPHCPACETRVLLGIDRIVHLAAAPASGHIVVLRCRCGGLVTWEARPSTRRGGFGTPAPPELPVPGDVSSIAEVPEAVLA